MLAGLPNKYKKVFSDMSNFIKVMIVDDSPIIQKIIISTLNLDPKINIIGTAVNGQEALDKISKLSNQEIDVILVDVQMPVMDGNEFIPKARALLPNVKIIIVSSLNIQDAQNAIKALMKYADDYLLKPSSISTTDNGKDNFASSLVEKIKILGNSKLNRSSLYSIANGHKIENSTISLKNQEIRNVEAIGIGCSTGGPQALNTIFSIIKNNIKTIPIFITQHMPANFTKLLANNLSSNYGINCIEAQDKEIVKKGNVYLAPGDFHMEIVKSNNDTIISLNQNPPEHFCRPSVNPMFKSLSKIYGDSLLLVMLTGMGSDGLEGSNYATSKGAMLIAQDEASSVVWGMPGVVANAGICSKILNINNIAEELLKLCK
jgi:two-component system chemotaxis response regulator CheB